MERSDTVTTVPQEVIKQATSNAGRLDHNHIWLPFFPEGNGRFDQLRLQILRAVHIQQIHRVAEETPSGADGIIVGLSRHRRHIPALQHCFIVSVTQIRWDRSKPLRADDTTAGDDRALLVLRLKGLGTDLPLLLLQLFPAHVIREQNIARLARPGDLLCHNNILLFGRNGRKLEHLPITGMVLSDEFELVSVRPVTLSFIPRKVRATRQVRRCVSP